mmetsp:Transcript_13764/g.32744  ORF Transcript_13764/g.32744 Transcript_13764/m.32744 type:complete len:268 (-) Transcript_13764:880-1683(-)
MGRNSAGRLPDHGAADGRPNGHVPRSVRHGRRHPHRGLRGPQRPGQARSRPGRGERHPRRHRVQRGAGAARGGQAVRYDHTGPVPRGDAGHGPGPGVPPDRTARGEDPVHPQPHRHGRHMGADGRPVPRAGLRRRRPVHLEPVPRANQRFTGRQRRRGCVPIRQLPLHSAGSLRRGIRHGEHQLRPRLRLRRPAVRPSKEEGRPARPALLPGPHRFRRHDRHDQHHLHVERQPNLVQGGARRELRGLAMASVLGPDAHDGHPRCQNV